MTLDIRGSIKNTKLSSNPYVVFDELISNAIDSYLIRKNGDLAASRMLVSIEVDFAASDLFDGSETVSIRCTDNGCGLGEDQLNAFLTKDTSYKDDLAVPGIGKCKGAGRIQFFHHFSNFSIDSTFRSGTEVITRRMHFAEPQKQIDRDNFTFERGNQKNIGTTITLDNIKDVVRIRVIKNDSLSNLFSAPALKKRMLLTFLQRLIGLENRLGDFEITFTSRNQMNVEQKDSLKSDDLPVVTTKRLVNVEECDPTTGVPLGTYQAFDLSHYRLDVEKYNLPKNSIAFCAKASPVKDVTVRYLRTKTEQNNPVNGFHHIILIESEYLDQRVNEQRDDFENISEEIATNDLFQVEKVSYGAIYDAIDPVIAELVGASDWKKESILKEVTSHFGISEAMLQDTSTRIVYGDSAKAVAERVLKKYQEKVIDETVEIVKLKDAIVTAEPDSEFFHKMINDLSWKYTMSLKNFDMANLSQLIVRRAAIVQILDLACNKKLSMQEITDDSRRKDERIIHSIFFPMRKDSNEFADHDIWLLSEEYHYFDYIASDVPLANIAWKDDEKLFESDIDDSFAKLLAKRAKENGGKRPDIALFSKEGSAIIVEFKAPGVQLDEHIGDLSEYTHLLAAKSGGKLKKFYGYLIGDSVNSLRLNGWTKFPTGKGFFTSDPLIDPDTGNQLGETYFEILHFNDVIARAKKRIGVYQSKLNFNLDGIHR